MTNPQVTRKRRRPALLAQLVSQSRSAPAVFLALAQEATSRGSCVVCTSRKRLSHITGIKKPGTISTALSALHACGWIHRDLVPRTIDGRSVTLLRIHLAVEPILPRLLRAENGHAKRMPKKGSPRGCRKSAHDSHREEVPLPPPSEGSRAPETDNSQQQYDDRSATKCTDAAVPRDPESNLPLEIAILQANQRGDRDQLQRLNAILRSVSPECLEQPDDCIRQQERI